MHSFIFYNLCALIIYAPLPLGANRIWASASIVFYVFALFLTHLINVLFNNKKLLPPNYSKAIVFPLTITCLFLTSQLIPGLGFLLEKENSTLSFDPALTHIMLLETLALTLFAWLVFSYVKTLQLVYKFCLSIFFAGLIQALYACWLNLNVGMSSPVFYFPYSHVAVGSFVYKNQLANFLALSLSIGVGVLVSQLSLTTVQSKTRQKIRNVADMILSRKVLIRIGLIIIIIALILTRSRMGNSAFFIALAVCSLFAFFYYNRQPKYLRILILSFFIVDFILVGAIFGVEKVKERLLATSLASETRDEVVIDSLPMILDNPFLGVGGGSYYSSFPQYQTSAYSGFYDHAHNDYIQFSVELGLPITALLGLMVLYCLYSAAKAIITRKTPMYQGVSLGCAIAIVHMLLHSTVDFSLQSPAIALLFMAVLSLTLIASNLKRIRS